MASRLRSPGLCAVLLLVVTAALYARTAGYPFVYEDLTDTARFQHTVLTGQLLNPARLLTMVTLDGSDWLTPGAARGGHLVNVAWHLVNVGLLLALAWLWLPPWGAVLAAAVFALHPLQVEAVAYVSGRSELVVASGVLLALLAASLGSLAGAVVGVVFACLGKESAIMAWGLVPLWALVTTPAFPLRRFLLIGAGCALCGAAYFLSKVAHLSLELDMALIGRTASSVMGLLALAVAPVWQSIDHDWRGVPLWLQSVSVGAIVALTTGACVSLLSGVRWWALAWLSTLLWFLPRFVVHNTEGLHEHHAYIPLIFFSLAVGEWFSRSPHTVGARSNG